MSNYADLIITHANVLTMDRARPRAEAVAIQGERIVFVGSAEEVKAWQRPYTRVIDAEGRTLLPGLIDSHFHLLWGSLKLDNIDCEGLTTYDELVKTVRSFAAANPDRPVLLGNGMIYQIGPNGSIPNRHDLDAIIPDRPLAIKAFDYHTVFANTKALEMAGLLHGAESPAGSEVVMGADGLATGELRESGAFDPVQNLAPKPDAAQKRALLRKGLEQAAAYGITSVHNMNGSLNELRLYAEAEAAGELTLRINVPLHVVPEMKLADLDEAIAMRDETISHYVRSNTAKFFMDGVIESYTALMLEPFANKLDDLGKAIWEYEQFVEMTNACDAMGLQIVTHAIGNGAIHRTLNAYEQAQRVNGRRDSRHRIEHIELLHPNDLPRFRQLGVIASMQPLHAAISGPGQIWAANVGEARWPWGFPWQSLRESGAHLTFGSDWPVVTQNPYLGIHAALSRQPWTPARPVQRQTLFDTLAGYTRDGAYTEFQEEVKGQLRRGMWADLVLLERNIEQTPVEQIQNMGALLTICGGRVVYQR